MSGLMTGVTFARLWSAMRAIRIVESQDRVTMRIKTATGMHTSLDMMHGVCELVTEKLFGTMSIVRAKLPRDLAVSCRKFCSEGERKVCDYLTCEAVGSPLL
jgi:hypothetical protein